MRLVIITLLLVLAHSVTLADNAPVTGLAYVFQADGRSPDKSQASRRCHVQPPSRVIVRINPGTDADPVGAIERYDGTIWIVADMQGRTTDGGAWASWVIGYSLFSVHLWHPDEPDLPNGRVEIAKYNRAPPSADIVCSDAWRYSKILTRKD